MESIKDLFMLDPSVVFLNHGSFGACPRQVFETYQSWQRRLEYQPVSFMLDGLPDYLRAARNALGKYLSVDGDDLVFVPNATFGVNVVARSLSLGPDDEVLATNHAYGACHNVWQYLSQQRGFHYRQQSIPLPVTAPEEIVESVWHGVNSHTRAIFISHITSATALRMPVEIICQQAREAGIITIIDGAHAPGQIPLDLTGIGADFYTGNAHKWLSAPKGSAFLYTRRERQHLIEPLVVSWGWGDEGEFSYGSRYLDKLQWIGTNDPAAYLSVPSAIQFQADHDWPAVRQQCHQLARQALQRICDLTGLQAPYSHDAGFYHQMVIAPLPLIDDLTAFKNRLYQEHNVEIPCIQWQDQQFLRVSVQGYNDQGDIDALLRALAQMLPAAAGGSR